MLATNDRPLVRNGSSSSLSFSLSLPNNQTHSQQAGVHSWLVSHLSIEQTNKTVVSTIRKTYLKVVVEVHGTAGVLNGNRGVLGAIALVSINLEGTPVGGTALGVLVVAESTTSHGRHSSSKKGKSGGGERLHFRSHKSSCFVGWMCARRNQQKKSMRRNALSNRIGQSLVPVPYMLNIFRCAGPGSRWSHYELPIILLLLLWLVELCRVIGGRTTAKNVDSANEVVVLVLVALICIG